MKSTASEPGLRHFQRTGKNATEFKKTRIHFKSDVFAAVAVVDAKGLPNKTPRGGDSHVKWGCW